MPDRFSGIKRGSLAILSQERLRKCLGEREPRALELNPKNTDALDTRAGAYAGKGQYDLAMADWATAIEIDTKNAEFYKNRARAYRSMKNISAAEADEAMYKKLRSGGK